MTYLQVEVRTGSLAAAVIADFLTERGALGVATEDPDEVRRRLAEPGSFLFADQAFLESLPAYTSVKAWFDQTEESFKSALLAEVQGRLMEIATFLPVDPADILLSELAEDDWADRWKVYFKPFHVSDRFVIVPSWETYSPRPGEAVIRLDPGAAFGTGQHESTALLIALMEKWLKPGVTVYDVGCGSGILSLIAERLGAAAVAATDLDPVAAETCRKNIAAADRADKIAVRTGDIKAFSGEQYDFILMNIIADVILAMKDEIPAFLKPGGRLICSGLLDERVPELVAAFADLGLALSDRESTGGWTALVFTT